VSEYSDPGLEIGPDTHQLVEESESVTRGLDRAVEQTDRFMQQLDDRLSHMDRPHALPDFTITESSSRPSSRSDQNSFQTSSNESREKRSATPEREIRKRRGAADDEDDAPRKLSVLEVEIHDEDDLVKALRKSAERMTASPRRSEKKDSISRGADKSSTDAYQRKSSAGRFEDTVSAYELRKREVKKPVILNLLCKNLFIDLFSCWQEETLLKKYMPAIAGGAVVLLVIILLISSMKSGHHKNKFAIKKVVKDAAREVCKDTIKSSKVSPQVQEKPKGKQEHKDKHVKIKPPDTVMTTEPQQATKKQSKSLDKVDKFDIKSNKTVKAPKEKKTTATKADAVIANATSKPSKKLLNKTMKSVTGSPAGVKTTKLTKEKAVTPDPVEASKGSKKEKRSPDEVKTPKVKKDKKVLKDCIDETKPKPKPGKADKVVKVTNTTKKGVKRKADNQAVNVTIKVTTKSPKK
jgi:hypothetical protein